MVAAFTKGLFLNSAVFNFFIKRLKTTFLMTAYWRQLTLVGCNCRQLHRDPSVLFAGYKLPHPLQYKMVVKIQTTSQSSPMQAYNLAITDLTKELDHLKAAFEQEMAQKQADYY